MKIKITIKEPSREDIKAVIFDNEIYDRVSDDGCPPKEQFDINCFFNTATKFDFLGGYINKKIISLFVVHDSRMHFMVLKPFRKYARELLVEFLRRYPRDIYVKISSCYKSVINFAKNNGFTEIKIESQTYRKNGHLYNDHILIYEGLCQ